MSSQTGKWREEQVLVICPGSQTTLAQMGCNELTPPTHRFPTRMFKDADSDDWRPFHTYKRKKEGANGASEGDDAWEYVEDTDSVEGAVYPIQGGFTPHWFHAREGMLTGGLFQPVASRTWTHSSPSSSTSTRS